MVKTNVSPLGLHQRLEFICLKGLGKYEKRHHFWAHAQWRSPWRRKKVEKEHLAPSNLTFLLIVINFY